MRTRAAFVQITKKSRTSYPLIDNQMNESSRQKSVITVSFKCSAQSPPGEPVLLFKTSVGQKFPMNFDLANTKELNWGCLGYEYYETACKELRKLQDRQHTGGCEVHHFDSWDVWKICFLQNGLLEGHYLQRGGIESGTLRAEYRHGLLHGHRVCYIGGGCVGVARFQMGVMECYYHQWHDGRVPEYHSRQFIYTSQRLCFHCFATHVTTTWSNKRRIACLSLTLRDLLFKPLLSVIACYLRTPTWCCVHQSPMERT